MRRGLLIGAVAASLTASAVLWPMPARSAGFCDPFRAPWVERQLRELPKIRDLPGGSLWGKRVVIYQGGVRGEVVVGGGPVAYEFDTRFGRVPLGWRVAIRVVRLEPGARGEEEQTVAFHRRRVRAAGVWRGSSPQIRARVPDERGLFRVDLLIRSRHGKFHGRIGRYLIGADPMYDVRMDTDLAVYSPGDRVRSEIENIGTLGINFVSFVGIQRQVEGQWVSVASGGPGTTPGEGLQGGQIGGCASAELPKDAPPGLYRATRNFGLEYTEEENYDIVLTAPFRVE